MDREQEVKTFSSLSDSDESQCDYRKSFILSLPFMLCYYNRYIISYFGLIYFSFNQSLSSLNQLLQESGCRVRQTVLVYINVRSITLLCKMILSTSSLCFGTFLPLLRPQYTWFVVGGGEKGRESTYCCMQIVLEPVLQGPIRTHLKPCDTFFILLY